MSRHVLFRHVSWRDEFAAYSSVSPPRPTRQKRAHPLLTPTEPNVRETSSRRRNSHARRLSERSPDSLHVGGTFGRDCHHWILLALLFPAVQAAARHPAAAAASTTSDNLALPCKTISRISVTSHQRARFSQACPRIAGPCCAAPAVCRRGELAELDRLKKPRYNPNPK